MTGMPILVLLAAAIALPDNPTAVERSAAEELADGIGRLTGSVPPVVCESAAADKTDVFFVGATARAAAVTNVLGIADWKDDEVLVRSVPNGVVVAGHPTRGPLYAADVYLEDVCGVRWWTSSESFYPQLAKLPTSGIGIRHAPQFKYRETYYLDSFDATFKVRTKGNFSSLTRYMLEPMEFVPPEKGGNHRLYYFKGRKSAYHSFFQVLPPSVHFAAHPEWYAEIGGERKPTQLCLTNDEMAEAFVAETKRLLREDPTVDFISVSQNDETRTTSAPPCACAKCRAVEAEEGGAHAANVLRFANRVAAALEPEFPHVVVDTFAYTWSKNAPTKTRPRHNVVVRFCDIECPFSFPLDTPENPVSARFCANLKKWSEIASGRLFIWDYVAGFRNYMIPHPNLRSLGANVRLFARAGAVGVFEQGDALCCAGELAPLRHWVVSHLLWNPGLDDRQLIDTFVKGYYGPSAAPQVEKYVSLVNDPPCEGRVPVKCYHYNVTNFMSTATAFAAQAAMAEAVRAAAKDGPAFAARVAHEKLSMDQVFLLNWSEYRAWAAANGTPWPYGDDRAAEVEKWIAAVGRLGVKAVFETVSRGPFSDYCDRLRKGTAER